MSDLDALLKVRSKWSNASVSQAERSVAGRFIRKFDADEVVAFARAFDLPLGWFFMPPSLWSDQPGGPVKLSTPDAQAFGTALAELVDLVFGDEEGQALLALRLRHLADPATGARQPPRRPRGPGQGHGGR